MDSKRKHRSTTNDNTLTAGELKEKLRKRGTSKRDELEAAYKNFKIGALIHEARIKKGLTQEELAQKILHFED